ncbi:Amino acid/polyamine transporter I [Niveomyces insectorum RCEF 264]|uniref:Amino acid/polyamine transporter I n=1 Tax=Niveomyces insectorum RCEF 264 TaxID=1081102 RepID=A0A167N170_9HYPO|nr:Amino acid/polyamine transporter I [Niveomyces insectorum RCEF 264]
MPGFVHKTVDEDGTLPSKHLDATEKGLETPAELGQIAAVPVLATEFGELRDLRQGLHQRHVQMIALAGTLGTGIFLSSGQAIARGGPLGALLGYSIVGAGAVAVVFAAAEMGALVPLNGGVIRYAEHFVDPALSFANGWNEVYAHIVSIPSELSAAAVLVEFWTTISNGVWITIFGLLTLVTALLFVRVYGEMEFGFSLLKIALVVGLNIMALVIVCGGGPDHKAIGFQYWRNPGPFVQYLGIGGAPGRFLGFWTVLDNALYAYSGIENISLTAGETRAPRTSIPMAARRVFWRILIFYVVSIFFVGLLVPSSDPKLLKSTGNAAQSPFVLAATRAGIRAVPSIINAVVLTSAWSAGNSSLLWGSRILYGMALEGRAPRVLTRVNRFGVPYLTVLFYGAFMGLAYMSLSSTAVTVFAWLKDLVAVATLVNWMVMTAVYLRFYYGMQKQGIARDELPWTAPLQPYLAWSAMAMFVLLLLTGGFAVFLHGRWSDETFVSSYVNIPIFALLYAGYKVIKRSKVIPLEDIPIRHFLQIYQNEPRVPVKPVMGWRRLNILWS